MAMYMSSICHSRQRTVQKAMIIGGARVLAIGPPSRGYLRSGGHADRQVIWPIHGDSATQAAGVFGRG